MTYSKRFGQYGIYTDGMIYKWFKELDNARKYWEENFAPAEKAEEWLEEYEEVELRNMGTGEVIESL